MISLQNEGNYFHLNFEDTQEQNKILVFLPPANKVWGKVLCLQACVCPQGECLTRYTPWEQTPPHSRHPLGAEPHSRQPHSRQPPRADTHPQSRHPQEQTPPRADTPSAEHAGSYGQCAGSTHPTGMQSCVNLSGC